MLQRGQDVVAVHDRDPASLPVAIAFGREQAQHGIGIGVKSAALHGGQIGVQARFQTGHAVPAHEQPGAVQHLLRRFARECEEQNGGRGHAGFHQSGQTVDNGAGFAAAGPGNHEQRAAQGGGGFKLGRVQIVAVINHALRGRLENSMRRAGAGKRSPAIV